MDTTGQGLVRLFNDTVYTAQAAWSPDGSRLAVARGETGHRQLVVVRPDGSDARALTAASGTAAWSAWSPDGNTILFDWDPGGNRDIYRISADGGSAARLTTDSAADNLARWNPRDSTIVFDSKRSGHWQVLVMDPDGSAQRVLGEGAVPVISRSGDRIVYQKAAEPRGTNFFVMHWDGTGSHALTTGSQDDALASFGPNDASIAFCSNREGSYEIYRMRADGHAVVRLTHGGH